MRRYLEKALKEYIISNILAILDVVCTSFYPLLLSYIIDHFSELGKEDIIKILCLFIISIVVLLVVQYFNKIVKARYQKIVCGSIRHDVFSNIITMNYTSFYKRRNEDYSSFLVNDVEQLYTLFFENLIYLSNTIIMLITYTVILGFMSPQMCAAIMGSLLLIVLVPQVVGKKFDILNGNVSSSKADYLMSCEEILYAHDLINKNNKEHFVREHNARLDRMQGYNYFLAKYRSFVQIFSGSMLYVQLILCFVAGLLFASNGIISLGVFASSLLYVEYVASYSCNIVDECLEIKSSKVYRDKCVEFSRKETKNNSIATEVFKSLTARNISYRIDERILFHDLSFDINYPNKYLIEGPNGSGKSTLLKILAGFIEPAEGKILFNGKEGISCDGIGYIPQRRYLFEGDVLSNITLFDDEISQRKKAQISELCRQMHFNYSLDYRIERNGQNLSGGEAAKICLIRELCRDNRLLLIDEPFNDIDDKSKDDILNTLKNMNVAMVIVSHGLNEKEMFDSFISIDN